MSASKNNKAGAGEAADMSGYEISNLFGSTYKVSNLNSWSDYYVRFEGDKWVCTCEAYKYGKGKDCKHILLVEELEDEALASFPYRPSAWERAEMEHERAFESWEAERLASVEALCASGYEELMQGMFEDAEPPAVDVEVDFMPGSHGEGSVFPVGMTIDVCCPF